MNHNTQSSEITITTISADDQLLRAEQIHKPYGMLPISRSSFMNLVKSGSIPKPIKLGEKTSCWRKSDILAFVKKMESK